MSAKTIAMIIIILYNVRICQSRHYDNFTLYSTVPTEADQLTFLLNLDRQRYINIMFWKKPSILFEDVHFIVSPADERLFNQRADHFNLKKNVMLNNVGKAFDAQSVKKYVREHTESFTWNSYHTLEDVYRWLLDMSAKYPEKMTLNSIGKSAEGRDIYAVTLKRANNKEKVIIEGGIHGNEWIGIEFTTYLVNELVAQTNSKHWLLHKLSSKYNWYIVPVVNPDGYAYSHTVDRLWRKNRRVTQDGIGADLNRNFDSNFGKYDSSYNARDDYYHGSHPFSEPETRALADFITTQSRNLKFYFTFHGYGQKMLIPFGDRINHLGNFGEMENYGKQAIIAIYRIYGKKYSVGTAFDTLGIPVEEDHMEYFMNLSKIKDVNFWREPGLMYKPVDFVVGPEAKPMFHAESERLGLYVTTLLKDVQKAFDKQTVKTYIRRKMETFDWNNFFRLDDIYEWLMDLAKVNPIEISVQSIGKTVEKREIMAVRIVLKGCKMRSKVIIEGGIHAREWISPAFVTYLIHQIIHSSTSDNEKLKEIALTYEWYFVPVLNPDGYEYSHTDDRQWRKNRNVNGVDLNRNFDLGFGTIGVSSQKASDTYCGKSAFSERESKAMKNFLTSKRKNLEYYFAFHSYGQYMIIPYANSKAHVENFEEVKKMCQQAAVLMSRRYKTKYSVGTAYDTVGYMTSGVSGCWVKKALKVPYVVTFELRDDGFYGFALPPHKIKPTCEETMEGLLHLLTPKENFTTKKEENDKLRALKDCSGPHFILDKVVMIFNVFLFIIVRFD